MRSAHLLLSALATVALSGPLAQVAQAEELEMAKQPQSEANRPARGMSMQKVEAAFGAPASRVPAIGTPPITRWEYPGYVVYCENNIVLHTVIKG